MLNCAKQTQYAHWYQLCGNLNIRNVSFFSNVMTLLYLLKYAFSEQTANIAACKSVIVKGFRFDNATID